MTKADDGKQRRHIVITVVILALVAVGFFVLSFVRQ